MTREQAHTFLLQLHTDKQLNKSEHEALRVVIKELDQELCEDCISRADAKEIIAQTDITDGTEPVFTGRQVMVLLDDLSSVTPAPKMGHWIKVIGEIDSFGNTTWHHECSICGNINSGWEEYKYCPNCGAKMSEIPTGSESEGE